MNKKIYRPNVSAVILSSNYPEVAEIFIAMRSDIQDAWQFPQGGIDENETPVEALYRELKEEIGTDEIEIISEYPEWITYDFPSQIRTKMYPFYGQKQRYFLVKLLPNASIDLSSGDVEFSSFRFVNSNEVLKHITAFKYSVYEKVLDYFKQEGYL